MDRQSREPSTRPEQPVFEDPPSQELGDWIHAELAAVRDLVMSRRADYGTLNIEIGGMEGIALRILDKACRLRTLAGGEVPEGEPLVDTLRDLIGYALIGRALQDRGEW